MDDTIDFPAPGVRRRTVLAGALVVGATVLTRLQDAYAATAGNRVVYNLNPDWRFVLANPANAQATSFDDAAWTTVSVPHTFNDVDSFDEWITPNGEHHVWRGITWYRKRFTMPANLADRKVFLEFEGIRQAATVYVNGTRVGMYEYGVTPFGFDITSRLVFGGLNVIAVKADNSANYREVSSNETFQWDNRDFNPPFGGLTRDIRMVVTPKTYFTLPLYTGLRTTGTYVYASDFSIPDRTATITVEAQVRNEQSTTRTITVSANILDASGTTVHTLTAAPVTLGSGQTQIVKLSGRVANLTFWEPARPYLYTVEMVLRDGATVQDVYPITTGFRKVMLRGGTTNGGVYLNDRYLFLTGYAIRSTNEWAVIGGAVPDWMRDYDGAMIRASHANFIRWMHISAPPANIRMTDRYGIVSVQPAGDKEGDVTGRRWDQRVEVMRDAMIYFRNSPSILFWEAGNQFITTAHMQQMTNLRKTWDPHGGRAMGCRSISDPATVDAAEWTGTMLNRHFSTYARDRMPILESEYTREEAPRRVWDNYSPPDFGYKTGPLVTWHLNSEEFASTVAAATRWEFWSQRIQGPGDRRYSGAAALIWADSNQHGRQYGWETNRLSGRVDAVRIPKESLHSFRVMQNPNPDLHIVGHWTYPANTTKTIFVIASAPVTRVALLVNGAQVGDDTSATQDFLYSFDNIRFQAGTLTAVGYNAAGQEVVRASEATAGPAVALKLTPYAAPGGLRADGSDIAFFDVEAVDAQGRRMPTHQARVDFTLTGPGRFLGGLNSYRQYSVHKSFIDTEAGINRVFVRAGRTAGTLTLRATSSGLTAGTASVTSTQFSVSNGLTTQMPVGY